MEEITHYRIRVRERARRDIEGEMVRLAEIAGDEVAVDWSVKLLDLVATLASMPQRCSLASENKYLQQEVRQLIYRRTPTGPAWRILFTIEDFQDGPTVVIRHVRHGARRPMTQEETGELGGVE